MATDECEREAETIRAAWGRAAGAGLDGDLEAHLASCPTCAEIAGVARSLFDSREAACAQAHVPPAAVVWWRAQRRAREEAARKAARPIALIHAIALGASAAAAVAMFSLGAGLLRWLEPLAAGLPSGLQRFAEASLSWPIAPALLVATTLILLPVAIYVAFASE